MFANLVFSRIFSHANPSPDDIHSGYWSVIEINVGVICVCLVCQHRPQFLFSFLQQQQNKLTLPKPPLHSLLSRQFKFFNAKRSRATAGSDGPYNHGASDGKNSELVTIGGSGPGRKNMRKRTDPENSEEELVYSKDDLSQSDNPMSKNEGGILKKTEINVTETITRDDDDTNQTRMKPWESHTHAL